MKTPLANRIRPTTINDVVGQHHLLDEGKALRRIIENNDIPNLIFYGPSGVGKTTVANIISNKCGKKLYYLNATVASTSDIKDIVKDIDKNENGILLYLDEIQYFNKKQQQILLSFIESGDITLIASTTENPYFYVYSAILSRSSVFEFKSLNTNDIIELLNNSLKKLNEETTIECSNEIIRKMAAASAGDARKALNYLELAVISADKDETIIIRDDIVEDILSMAGVRYDRDGDEHYDIISAYQKSMRGSDPNAALYYLGRLLVAGDLASACRRLLVCANEDVGLAYPQIISMVKDAVDTALMVGLPEARLPLANAVVLVATSPKSNSTHDAINAIMTDIEKGAVYSPPRHLQNKHYDGRDAEVKGQHYLYPHHYPKHYVKQQYLPDELKNKKYFEFGNSHVEQKFKAFMDDLTK